MEYPKLPYFPFGESRENSMPASYEIDKQRRLVFSTGVDPFTLADGLAHQEKLAQDPDFDPSFSQIIDFTRIAQFDLEASGVRRLAQRTLFSPGSRRAIIVSTDLAYGFGRMYEILRENYGDKGIRVFRNLDKALDWILSKNLTA
jgi:hypothetical protein